MMLFSTFVAKITLWTRLHVGLTGFTMSIPMRFMKVKSLLARFLLTFHALQFPSKSKVRECDTIIFLKTP